MIKILKPDTSPGVPYPVVSTGEYVRPRGLITIGGASLDGRLPADLLFQLEDGPGSVAGLPDFIRGAGFILVSERLKSLFQGFGAEVEYLPAHVEYHGADVAGYSIANPLCRIKGVDLNASSIEVDEAGFATEVDNLVLDEKRFAGHPLAVIHETLHLAVQEGLAAMVASSKVVGCQFVDPSSIRI